MLGSWCMLDRKFTINSRVYLKKDHNYIGNITKIEENRLSVMIQWDDCDGEDFQWANKIELV